jgi:magnesium-transporting ATPase (P-type)
MAPERVSYRNPLISALLYSFLFFVVTNIFYWVFNEKFYFQDYHYFEWIEYVLGTAVMFVLALIVEFVRNLMGRKGETKPESPAV